MQMVSHPESLADGVPSWSLAEQLLQWVSHPVNLLVEGWCPILVTAPEIARGGGDFW